MSHTFFDLLLQHIICNILLNKNKKHHKNKMKIGRKTNEKENAIPK